MNYEIELRRDPTARRQWLAVFRFPDRAGDQFPFPDAILWREGQRLSGDDEAAAIVHWLRANSPEAAAFLFESGIWDASCERPN